MLKKLPSIYILILYALFNSYFVFAHAFGKWRVINYSSNKQLFLHTGYGWLENDIDMLAAW